MKAWSGANGAVDMLRLEFCTVVIISEFGLFIYPEKKKKKLKNGAKVP